MSIFLIKKPTPEKTVQDQLDQPASTDSTPSIVLDNDLTASDIISKVLNEKLALKALTEEKPAEQISTEHIISYYCVVDGQANKAQLLEKIDRLSFQQKVRITAVDLGLSPAYREYLHALGHETISLEQFEARMANSLEVI